MKTLSLFALMTAATLTGSVAETGPEQVERLLPPSLDVSIRHLIETYPEYAPRGNALLAQLVASRSQQPLPASAVEAANKLRLEVVVSHPLIQQSAILFTTRRQFRKDHHNTATLFQPNETNRGSYQPGGSQLKTIDFAQGGKITTLVEPGATGVVRDPEVRWDGEKIVFSMRKHSNATWLDMNAPYYPSYDSAYAGNASGRSPLDKQQLARLTTLTGAKFVASHSRNAGPQVSFDRPALSPCLKGLETGTAPYEEALGIVRAGQQMLEQHPRADMPGFIAAEYALKRQRFYAERLARERESRKAIREGRNVYDE